MKSAKILEPPGWQCDWGTTLVRLRGISIWACDTLDFELPFICVRLRLNSEPSKPFTSGIDIPSTRQATSPWILSQCSQEYLTMLLDVSKGLFNAKTFFIVSGQSSWNSSTCLNNYINNIQIISKLFFQSNPKPCCADHCFRDSSSQPQTTRWEHSSRAKNFSILTAYYVLFLLSILLRLHRLVCFKTRQTRLSVLSIYFYLSSL